MWPQFDPKCRVLFIFSSINKINCLWFYGVWTWKLHYGSLGGVSSSGGLCTYYYKFKKDLCFLVLQDCSLVGSCGPSWLGETRFEFDFMWKQRQMQLMGFLWDSNCLWIGSYGNGISDSIEFAYGKLCERPCTKGENYEKDKYDFKSCFWGKWTIDGNPKTYHEVIISVYRFLKIYRLVMSALTSWNSGCTIIYFMPTDLEGLIKFLVTNIRIWDTGYW